jgi:hypothetical protein
MAHNKLLKGRHNLAALQTQRGAVDFLSSKSSFPRKAAREGASDDLRDHSHAGVVTFPAFNQPSCGYVRSIGMRNGGDQRRRKGSDSRAVQFAHVVQLCGKIFEGKFMPTWLRSLVNAFLGKVPGKTSRLDTATRMMIDADFSLSRELPRETRQGVTRTPVNKRSLKESK